MEMKQIQVILVSLLLTSPVLYAQQREFSIYGYIDLEFEYGTEQKKSTFDIHHFNLLTEFQSQQVRVFSEIEFEHGASLEPDGGEGEIALERAWVEYTHSGRIQLRAGKFLTPFGIYNLIHDATPTFLTTSLPFIYGKHNPFGVNKARLYAKFYTGLQVLGTLSKAGSIRLNYTLGVGNGRGPEQFSKDNDNNKSLSARLLLQSGTRLQVGVSHYRDHNAEGLSGKQGANEQVYGLDLQYDTDTFLLQSELALFRMERNIEAGGFQTAKSWYIQLAYRVQDLVTPVLRYDFFDRGTNAVGDSHRTWLLGVNISPNAKVYFKGEVQFNMFSAPDEASNRLYLSSISVAF